MTGPIGRYGRELGVVVLAAAAASGVALLAIGRTWAAVRLSAADVAPLDVAVSGGDALPWLRAAALVALAAVGAVLVTANRARIAAGVLLGASGAVLAWGAATAADAVTDALRDRVQRTYASADGDLVREVLTRQPELSGWTLVLLGSGLTLVLLAAVTVVRGRRWPAMGRRYERVDPDLAAARPIGPEAGQEAGPEADPQHLWRELSDGRDPTR